MHPEGESGPGAQVPAAIHLRYGVDGEVNQLTIETTPGEVSGDFQEWSAEVPTHVPQLIDPVTSEVAVDFFGFAALLLGGNRIWELGSYADQAGV